MNRFKKYGVVLIVPVLFWTGAARADSCPQCSTIWEQVVQTGTPDQVERARAIVNDARKALYGILAEDIDGV